MKLEGELAFYHSKMGVEPESHSFEFKDGDQNSTGYKLQNRKKAKEYENRASVNLKKDDWGLDPSPYDMKSANCKAEPKLEFYNSTIDLRNDHEARVVDFAELKSNSFKDKRGLESAASKAMPKLEFYDSVVDSKSDYEAQAMDIVEPVSHSSKDIGSFMKFSFGKQSVKKSATSPISNRFQNSVDAYMDKAVTEREPEMVVCYKDNHYQVVKDICVDEGVVTKHRLVFEDIIDDNGYNFYPAQSFGNKEIQKDNTGVKVLNLPATDVSDQVSANHDHRNNVMHKAEDASDNFIGNASKEMVLPEGTQDSIPFDAKGGQLSTELHSQSKGSKNMVQETVLARPPALGFAVDDSNSDGTRSFTYHFEPSAPAHCRKKEFHHLGGCECDEIHHTLKPFEGHYYDHGETSQIRNSLGETSFSAAGAVSGRISYSGSIPYSGSISIRSDSSTTSTRSFAFPILQTEWNTSPVRMVKPERSSFRKQRCWRQSLLCCKF